MAERAERLGGWIEVSSLQDGATGGAESGTVIFLTLPLEPALTAGGSEAPDALDAPDAPTGNAGAAGMPAARGR